jgi:N-acetylglucosaminyldiphosphoundecaprenol N-acetyl-beta-D-mannosaminyltransferase
MELTLQIIAAWISKREPNYVCVTPAHAIMDYRRDPSLMKIVNQSGLTTPDGMSIVWILRKMGFSQVERVYGPDLLLEVCEQGLLHHWRHFFYGGAPDVAKQLTKRLQTNYPGLIVSGTFSPPFRDLTHQEEVEVTKLIQNAKPDIVWVGLSSPKQERWMFDHIHHLNVPVLVGIGAAFDFHSGRKPQAPKWIQKAGLEWIFRLLSEPKRLWRRYAEYPYFVLLVTQQLLKMNRANSGDQ